jgi:hypothetical protein
MAGGGTGRHYAAVAAPGSGEGRGEDGGGWAEILGVVSRECRLEMAGWRAYLPVGLSHTPNDDDSIVVVVLSILYSGDGVWGPGGGLW